MAQAAINRLIQARHAQINAWERQAIELIDKLKAKLNQSRKKYTGTDITHCYDSSENELGIESTAEGEKIVVFLRRMRDLHYFPRSETRIEFEFPKAANPQWGPIKITAYDGREEKASLTLARSPRPNFRALREQVELYVADLKL